MIENEKAAERRLRLQGKGWIGVDFDGTLAEYHGWTGWNVFGKPIPAMVERVKTWIAEGQEVRIMTARVTWKHDEPQTCYLTKATFTNSMMQAAIGDWCVEHVGERLGVTCVKDVHMIELWDDRAVQVIPNTGQTLADAHLAEMTALHGKAQGPEPERDTMFERYDPDCIPGN